MYCIPTYKHLRSEAYAMVWHGGLISKDLDDECATWGNLTDRLWFTQGMKCSWSKHTHTLSHAFKNIQTINYIYNIALHASVVQFSIVIFINVKYAHMEKNIDFFQWNPFVCYLYHSFGHIISLIWPEKAYGNHKER